jgi:hypothetical protein
MGLLVREEEAVSSLLARIRMKKTEREGERENEIA